ncbi:MAG: hypothetical protein EZS28_055467, partial [Streblomastix strix]
DIMMQEITQEVSEDVKLMASGTHKSNKQQHRLPPVKIIHSPTKEQSPQFGSQYNISPVGKDSYNNIIPQGISPTFEQDQQLGLETIGNKSSDQISQIANTVQQITIHDPKIQKVFPQSIQVIPSANAQDDGKTIEIPDLFLRLWYHEATRVFSDLLTKAEDKKLFKYHLDNIVVINFG